jgi:hypothetical protein
MLTHLLVRARGTARVQDFDALDAGIHRYIGRRVDASACVTAEDHKPHHGNTPDFVHTGQTCRVTNRREVLMALRDGDLWAADEETAKAAFGPAWRDHFDPNFGGEFASAEKGEG